MSQVLKIKHEATPGGCVIFITVDTDEIIGVRLTDGHVIDLRERPPYWCTSPCMYCNGTKGSDCFKDENALKHVNARLGVPYVAAPVERTEYKGWSKVFGEKPKYEDTPYCVYYGDNKSAREWYDNATHEQLQAADERIAQSTAYHETYCKVHPRGITKEGKECRCVCHEKAVVMHGYQAGPEAFELQRCCHLQVGQS